MSGKGPPRKADSSTAHLRLRMSTEVRDAVEEAATANGRSMNAEIIRRLEVHDSLVQRIAIAEAIEERLLTRTCKD